ncbi:MAG: bifunctional metallophosphatase/5'-nucleotidase [Dehalococcoidia bacterium]|nr:bifunctional metallophosphatase/5'-nucleotidase [Dehalococcoidia bacterium]
MRDKNKLSRADRGLLSILTAVLALALFLSIPGNPGNCAGETEELYFCILHTNDMHSELIPHSPAVDYRPGEESPAIGGFARLATAVDEIRENKMKEGEPVLLFDAGDFLGGAPFAWLALDGYAAELTVMQEMGYDAVTLGNHEYDYGADVLGQYLLQAGYPEAHEKTLVLASNTEAPSDHPLAAQSLYSKTGMFELENGLKVGVFGIVGEGAIRSMGETGDMQFLDQHETARRMVDDLKEQGADVIVAISHCGVSEDRELARAVPGIDVIVGGHCHTALFEPILEGTTVIVQAGSVGMYLGQLELAYNSNTDKVRVRNEENDHSFLIPIDDSFASDPEIAALIQEYTLDLNAYVEQVTEGKFDDVMSTVARSNFTLSNLPPLNETALGNFVTDAMRFVAQEFTGKRVDIASEAGGNIRNSVFPGTMGHSAGNISFYDIAEATGVGRGRDGRPGCPIASVYFTGEEVRHVLELSVLLQELMGDSFFLHLSGLRYSYNPANAVLLTVPFVDLPIPTIRAVTSAELYTGDGIQTANSEQYVPLGRGDEELYHLVANGYLLLFLPLVTDLLPQLEIVAKNADGEPVPTDRLDELIIRHPDGSELKVWEAVVMYALAQGSGADGIPQISGYYANVAGRITKVWTFPLVGWLLLILAVIVAGIVYLVVRRRRRRISCRDAVPIQPAAN